MYSEFIPAQSPEGEVHARSWEDGQAVRPALEVRRALAFGHYAGVTSAAGERHREAGCALLDRAGAILGAASPRSAQEAAHVLQLGFSDALEASFHGVTPTAGFGAGLLVMMPQWSVCAFSLVGETALWRRERSGALTEIARTGTGMELQGAGGGTGAPLIVLHPGDRLLLATGPASAIATEIVARAAGDAVSPRALLLALWRATELPGAIGNGSLMVASGPQRESRRAIARCLSKRESLAAFA